ncbi:MAG TPA: hypothetical protein VMF31_06505 [Solirubrobacterales bacterium]|nr:hypothetical protein [Solirubrobacterales bacterium]
MSIRAAAQMFVAGKASLTIPAMLALRVDPDGPDAGLGEKLLELTERAQAGTISDADAKRHVAALLVVF